VTEHEHDAKRVMGLAHDNQNQGNWETAQIQIQRALVHATLALVEQQRIANLIAFRNMLTPANKIDVSQLHKQDLADFHALVPIVREGLGL